MNVTMLLQMVAQAAGERTAVIGGDVRWTYDDLVHRATAWAAAIEDRDVKAVAYVGENSAEAVALFFGTAVAGVSYVPVNYRWTDQQLHEALTRIAPVAVVTDERSAPRVRGLEGVHPIESPDPERVAEFSDTDGEFPAVLLFTSGTSGTPKAAILRNRHLVPYVLSTVDFLNADPSEAILVSVPPYHIAAVSSMITSLYAGRKIVLLTAFDAQQWVDLARREEVTQAMVVPTMLDRILDVVESDGRSLPSLRHLSYGGGRMPVDVIERTLRLLPDVDLVNAYGLTETSSTISLLGPEDHRTAAGSDDPAVRARLGSVGRALPSVEIEIRDDDGTVLAAGEAGEIWVRGEQVSGEYLSHSAIGADGWYPTRDHGHLDADGFLYLHGRADDVIVRGGENISPNEIEDRLRAHPSVDDVAVVGIPDAQWGERIEAFVVGSGVVDVDVLKEWVREGLRSTRVPQYIHQQAELPYNETGKLLRRVLKNERVAAQ
ncbi:class I adenylate-forming enzyme family protein [Gordonia sp. NPDC058843]|uniref:class I adenylate-forming enzyme family protein n=1 Tax=Gordonia sp. NPDC058843 TaxID=3346648 RepID=UPI003680E9CB